jgi:hypothetical protein
MRKFLIITSILVLNHFLWQITATNVNAIENMKIITSCVVGGCSSQLCVDAAGETPITTCEWREEYACYRSAVCERQSDGSCGWTMTDDLKACLEGNLLPPPTPITPTPVCGNLLCEPGESDVSDCPICTPDMQICPLLPCYYKPGTCPSDCEEQKPVFLPTLSPEPTPIIKPSPHPDACINSGGNWRIYTDSCADNCYLLNNPNQNCLIVMTNACDCGLDKCWNGEKCAKNPIPQLTPQPTKPWFTIPPKPQELISKYQPIEKPSLIKKIRNFFTSLQAHFQNYWIERS